MILFLCPSAPNPPPSTPYDLQTQTHAHTQSQPRPHLLLQHVPIGTFFFHSAFESMLKFTLAASTCARVLAHMHGRFCEPGSACLVVMLKCRPPRPRSHPRPGRRLTLAGPDREPAWRGTHGAPRQPTEPAHSVCAGVATPGQTQLARTHTCAQTPTRPHHRHPTPRASRCPYARFLGLICLLGVFISSYIFVPSKYLSLPPLSLLFFNYSCPPSDVVANRKFEESL